jgi:hypothetical protein
MKNLFLIVLAAIIIASFGCNKDSDVKYTIKGKFTRSCDDTTPISRFNLILYLENIDAKESKTIATTTTNERGEFTFQYSTVPNSNSSIGVSTENGRVTYLHNIPKNRNFEANIYAQENYFYIIKIKTDKPYTTKDTLFYLENANNKNFILGPFYNNQVLDTVVLSAPQFWADGANETPTTYIGYSWKLGSEYNIGAQNYIVSMNLTPCKKYNEVIFDLTKL